MLLFSICHWQGVLGIKVKIQLPHDPTGRDGVARRLPDVVTFVDPKDDYERVKVAAPYAQNFGAPTETAAQAVQQPAAQTPAAGETPQ